MTTQTHTQPWLTVMRHEIRARLDKAFLISTALTLVALLGFLGYQAWSAGRADTTTIAASQADAPMARAIGDRVTAQDEKQKVEVRTLDDAAAKAAVQDESVDAWLHRDGDQWRLTFRDDIPTTFSQTATLAVRDAAVAANASAAGTSVEELSKGGILVADLLNRDADTQMFAKALAFIAAILFYMATLGFGMMLANSVVEEKQSRLVEIIASRIPVRHLLAGKVLGNSLLAIGQTALFVGAGVAGMAFTPYASMMPAVSGAIGWFVVFFIPGFLLLACLWAVAGSLASRTEDVQSTAMPLTMLTLAMYLGSFFLTGPALVVASYLPPVSAILMPMRLFAGDAAWWEPVIALGLLLAASLAVVLLAERLYRRSLLQTQGRLTIKDAWRSAD